MRFVLAVALCILTFGPAEAGDTKPAKLPFKVVLVVDPRIPSVSTTVVEEALRIAANWIEVWYQKRIRFAIDRTESIDSYITGSFRRLPVPESWKQYSYSLDGTDTVDRFILQQTSVLRQQSIPELKSYVPDAVKPLITTPEDAAKNLLHFYDAKFRLWKSLRTPAGVPYFDTSLPQKHSYWYWERIFESFTPEQVKDHLLITNVPLLDDALADAPPHSLLRGGLLNGMAEEECPQAIISTFPTFTDIPAISDLRDTSVFSANDRVLALAHIIAHEFGTHVVQGYKDVYDHDACLAVPASGLNYVAMLKRLKSGAPCKLDHPKFNRQTNMADRYESLARRYLDIKDYKSARDDAQIALDIDPSRTILKLMVKDLDSKLKSKTKTKSKPKSKAK